MVLSKAFLDEKISEYREKANNETDPLVKNNYLGTVTGFEIAYKELTRPPKTKDEIENEKKMKVFDPHKVVEPVIEYYIKHGKTRKEAERIALMVVKEQQQKRMNEFLTHQDLQTKCHHCGLVQPSINPICAECGKKLDWFENIFKD